jgi:hypothetical protein
VRLGEKETGLPPLDVFLPTKMRCPLGGNPRTLPTAKGESGICAADPLG